MRAVFEHSWRLLAPEEQQVLRRLTVFRGGFTRAAAKEVAGATLVVLAALVDKSLVRRAGERYDLHEVVRQGAAIHLDQDVGETTATRDRHAAYVAALLADRERALTSPAQRVTAAELAVELDNLRAAWRWAGQRRRFAQLRQALRSLHHFFEIRGSYEEAIDLFRQAVEALGSTSEIETARNGDERLLHGDLVAEQAWFAFRYGRFEQASSLMHRALALLGPQTAEAARSAVLPYLWMLRPGRGDYAEGQQLLRQRVALLRAQGDQLEVAVSLLHLGLVAQFQDDHREGYRLMREALTLARSLGDPLATARILGFASGAATAIGAYAEGKLLAEECIAINRETSDQFSIGVALHTLGRVAHAQGQYAEARSRYEASLAIFEELGDRWNRARALSKLGHTLQALGESGDAYRAFLVALETLSEVGALAREIDAVLGLALLLRDRGKVEQSAELCLHVLHRVAEGSPVWGSARQFWSELIAVLPEQQVTTIEERVRARPLEAAVAELLTLHAQ
jgi:tetratricopeptide (TPR) repeat protein